MGVRVIDAKSFAEGLVMGLSVAMGCDPSRQRLLRLVEIAQQGEFPTEVTEESTRRICGQYFPGPEGPCQMADLMRKEFEGREPRIGKASVVLDTIAKMVIEKADPEAYCEDTQEVSRGVGWLRKQVNDEMATALDAVCKSLLE